MPTDVLCASPKHLSERGIPKDVTQMAGDQHDCLIHRFPGAPEFQWPLMMRDGVQKIAVSEPFESDDSDVLTGWVLDGHGIILKPVFEISDHLRRGDLVPILQETPPVPVLLASPFTHRRHRDPKTRIFIDFITKRVKSAINNTLVGQQMAG